MFSLMSLLSHRNRAPWVVIIILTFRGFTPAESDPAFRRIVEDPTVRKASAIGSGGELAPSLRKLFKAAHHESFRYSGWDGVFDRAVNAFLDQYPQNQE